jgi:hypothetical protein
MMNVLRMFLLVSVWLALPSVASARAPDLSWTYVDISATGGEIDLFGDDDGDVDFTEGTLSGSYGVSEYVALVGGVSGGTIETSELCFCTDIDSSAVALGVALHYPISPRVDLVAPLLYRWVEFDDDFDSIDDSGYSVGAGFRWRANVPIELSAGVYYTEIFDDDSTSVSGSIRWHINELFSLATGIEASDDSTSATLNGRFSF